MTLSFVDYQWKRSVGREALRSLPWILRSILPTHRGAFLSQHSAHIFVSRRLTSLVLFLFHSRKRTSPFANQISHRAQYIRTLIISFRGRETCR
jgi:hypothetical protein